MWSVCWNDRLARARVGVPTKEVHTVAAWSNVRRPVGRRKPLLAALAALALVGCWPSPFEQALKKCREARALLESKAGPARAAVAPAKAIDWRRHVVLRPDGQRPGESDTQERMVAYALHYTSIRLESFLLFNLPGVPSGVPVAVGLRITNLLPDRNLDMLLGVYRSVGDRAEVSGSGRTAALPIVYAGREVTITVYVVALAKDEAEFLSGQMFAVSFSRSDPASERTVDLEGKLFASVFDTYRPRERDRWIYAFTLYPADSVYSIRPDLLLLAGRSILVLSGAADGKPAAAAGRPPEPFEGQVELRDGKLLWKKQRILTKQKRSW